MHLRPGDQYREETDNCSITVAADGTLSVTASDFTISATLNGDSKDSITSPNNDEIGRLVSAHGINGDETHTVRVGVLRGYVTEARGQTETPQSPYRAEVSCVARNPNPRRVGDGEAVQSNELAHGGATAADLARELVGTYSNGTCSVTVSEDGVFTFKDGAVTNVSARMAGDPGADFGDTVAIYPSATEFQAGDFAEANGEIYQLAIKLLRVAGQWRGACYVVGGNYEDTRCSGLVKQ